MKKMILGFLAALVACSVGTTAYAGESNHRLGVGANYWVVLDDLEDDDLKDPQDDGFSYFASYQYWPGLLGFELQVEMFPDWIGEDNAYAPQAYVLLGSGVYVGVGIGLLYFDEDWADDPFYAAKAGLNFELLPDLFLDLSANYRFNSSTQFKDDDTDIDTDTVFLGAALRLAW